VRRMGLLGVGVAGILAVAGCASSMNSSGAKSSGSAVVTSRNIAGVGTALVDASGRTLYFADQENGGAIHCMGPCLQFWMPLTVPNGSTPTAAQGVSGNLTTVHRPDGSSQVAFDGKPLYLFVQDSGPGKASGNGFNDSFSGVSFNWHAATTSGSAGSTTPSPSRGNGYGY
jgi:predicted lipoprotein with Yx(FWY)xxD motif